MKFTKREIIGIFLILIIGLLSLGSWRAFFSAMMTPGVSDIWRVVAWFFVLTVFFFLGATLWTNFFLRIVGVGFIFLPGLFFIRSWEYILVGVISTAFIFWSSRSIAKEAEERVHFNFFKSARIGQFLFIFGLSLIISGGYYVFLKNAPWEELVPRFRVGEEMTGIIFKIAGTINPSFAKLSAGSTTVDEFLLDLEKNQLGGGLSQGDSGKQITQQDIENAFPQLSQYTKGKNIVLPTNGNQEKIAQKIFLESGREQIATLVGRSVAGDEKVSDLLSIALQNKLIALLSGGKATEHVSSQAVPFFLALLLFLTLLSFASLFVPVCILGAHFLFAVLLWVGWLKISTFVVEQERLVD